MDMNGCTNSFTPVVKPDFPPGLALKMLEMKRSLDDLQKSLAPLLQKPHHEILAKLNPLERAKIHIMEDYTVQSLFYALVKISGDADTSKLEAEVEMEMVRLKGAQNRLGEIEARATMQRIDREAARRFVQHGLGKRTKRKTDEANTKTEVVEMEEEINEEEAREMVVKSKKKRSKIQKAIDDSWQ